MTRTASEKELITFHDPIYVKYLKKFISPSITKTAFEFGAEHENLQKPSNEQGFKIFDIKRKQSFNQEIGEISDCPGFPGVYNYGAQSAGASIDAARLLINNEADIVIN